MVASATSLSHSGLRDWLIQRVSAVVIGLFVIILFGFFLVHPGLTFKQWNNFITNPVMQMVTFLALLSTVAHAWIGVWTVLTDYVKPLATRLFLEIIIVLGLITYLVWGTQVIWGL